MGLNVGEYNIAIDTKDPNSNVNFVSHAHTDHICGLRKNKKAITSKITSELVKARNNIIIEEIDVPKEIKLLNAGHMLGSTQLHITLEEQGCSILYSGDYQMQKSVVAERIEIKEADILFIDSTYPYVNIEFDEREEVITAMQHYIKNKLEKGSVIFGAYSMGKSQEIIRICNDFGVTPLVDNKIAQINKVYQNFGINLDYSNLEQEDHSLSEKGNFVGVVSLSTLNKVKEKVQKINNRNVFTAVATGFARMFKFNTDVQFALSDHADFKQATQYIDLCTPKIIHTCGSNSVTFAKNLKASGYNAYSLGSTSKVSNLLLNYVQNR